jgi:hypothetical protein
VDTEAAFTYSRYRAIVVENLNVGMELASFVERFLRFSVQIKNLRLIGPSSRNTYRPSVNGQMAAFLRGFRIRGISSNKRARRIGRFADVDANQEVAGTNSGTCPAVILLYREPSERSWECSFDAIGVLLGVIENRINGRVKQSWRIPLLGQDEGRIVSKHVWVGGV